MNPLLSDLISRLHRNDSSLQRLAISRLPLWKVSAGEIRALVQALQDNTFVTHLDFWLPEHEEDDDDDYDMDVIEEKLLSSDKNVVFDVSYLESVFAHNISLRSLQVGCGTGTSQCDEINRKAWYHLMRGLKTNNNILKLELDGTKGSRGIQHFGLDNTVCGFLATYLAQARYLKELIIHDLLPRTNVGLLLLSDGLKCNQSIETIEISHMHIPVGAETSVWSDSWSRVLTAFSVMPCLETLCMIYCNIPLVGHSSSVSALCQSKSIRSLRWIESGISELVVKAMSEGLKKNTSLSLLDLRGNGLSLAHCKDLGEYLAQSSQQLQKLILEENLIGDEGLESLAQGLMQVYKVNLRCNLISAHGCQLFWNQIEQNKTPTKLRCLDLSENVISDAGMKYLGDIVARCEIRELEADSCFVSDEGLANFYQSLGKHRNLPIQGLSLAQNRLSPRGIAVLADMLADNSTLVSIDLSSCQLTDDSIAILVKGLRKNQNLEVLSLAFNCIGNDGAEALGRILPSCRLRQLDCQFNALDDEGISALAEGLYRSVWLEELFVLDRSHDCIKSYKRSEKISFWLALNRAGRKAAHMETIPDALWPRVLERAERIAGPSAVFYILKDRPDLSIQR